MCCHCGAVPLQPTHRLVGAVAAEMQMVSKHDILGQAPGHPILLSMQHGQAGLGPGALPSRAWLLRKDLLQLEPT